MRVETATADQRPDLWVPGIADADIWPEYNLHGDVVGPFWPRLLTDLAAFQLAFFEPSTGEVVAEGHTAPCWWDGNDAGLPAGIDALVLDVAERLDGDGRFNALCALAAEIPPRHQGRGLARVVLAAMGDLTRRHGLGYLIAPVRPSRKHRYPITPIERYVRWRRSDGALFDPWMRVHERLGARLGPPAARSLRITGSVPDWTAWTGLELPESGEYTFPEGLAPLAVDREADTGLYWEPNVWMVRAVAS